MSTHEDAGFGPQRVPAPLAFSVCQVAVSTSDLVGSLRLFDNLFSFSNAGGSALWGQAMRVTGLSHDARTLVWWLVGEQPFFQLELFEYTHPAPSGPPAGPAAQYGWTRIGIAVPDAGRVAEGLAGFDIEPLIPLTGPQGARTLSFREPFSGFVIEVIEYAGSSGPAIVYATQVVPDLEAARRLHATILGASVEPAHRLPINWSNRWRPDRDSLSAGFLARYGDFAVDVQHRQNSTTAGPFQRQIYDYGIINLALGTRDFSTAANLIKRLQADGHRATEVIQNGQIVGTYFVDPGCEFEIFSLPEEFDSLLGFCATTPFVANMGF